MLPTSGQISLSDINVELGKSASSQITMNDTGVRKIMARNTNASEIGMNAAYGRIGGSIYSVQTERSNASNGVAYSFDPNTLAYTTLGDTGIRSGTSDSTYSYFGGYAAWSSDTICYLFYRATFNFPSYTDPIILTSKDYGASWTRTNLPNLGYPFGSSSSRLTYLNGKFFLLWARSDYTANRLFYSSDGINWSYLNLPQLTSKQNNFSMTYDGTYYRIWGREFSLGGKAVSLVSTDAINWSQGPTITLAYGAGDSNYGSYMNTVEYGGGVYLLQGYDYVDFIDAKGENFKNWGGMFLMRSTDGVNWSTVPGYYRYDQTWPKAWQRPEYVGNNTWLCQCTDAYYYPPGGVPFSCNYLRSTNGGQTWSSIQNPLSGSYGVSLGNRFFLTKSVPNGTVYGVFQNVKVYVSTDYGATWTYSFDLGTTSQGSTRMPLVFL